MSTPTYESYLQGKLGLALTITYVPIIREGSNRNSLYVVSFPAYLTQFSDSFESKWNSEDVYGRMDPIATYQGTSRALTVSWTVPAYDYRQARSNLSKIDKLISFLYPIYDDENNGGTGAISTAPLIKVKFGNMICNAKTGSGLLGYVDGGITVEPDLEQGVFHGTTGPAPIYPKAFNLSFTLRVLHEHRLGWNKHKNLRMSNEYLKPINKFPYRETFETATVEPPRIERTEQDYNVFEDELKTSVDGHIVNAANQILTNISSTGNGGIKAKVHN